MPTGMQQNACLSCRERKLKCDRKQPCANCVARSCECKEQLLSRVNRGPKRTLDASDPSTISNILTRLDRIEGYINAKQDNKSRRIAATSVGNEINGLECSILKEPLSANVSSANEPIPLDQLTGGVERKVLANDDILRHALVHDLSISVSADYQGQQPTCSRQVCLPAKEETLRLFQVYFDYVGIFQHIIYEPHSRKLIEDVYYQLAHVSTKTAPPGLALILSVIAIATTLQPLKGNVEDTLPTLKERLRVSAAYVRSSMDCLEQYRRRMNHSLEGVQAILVLQFLINHIEAFSARYRTLLAEAITMSHSIGLHRIDATAAKGSVPRDTTDARTQEIMRRAWWYLTATDWLVSMTEGPFDAVYLVQAKHIMTNIPRHIDAEDLSTDVIEERPLSQPTTMSYFLQRVKVAEIARCISDVVPHNPNTATCGTILALDSKLESLIQNLPAFFRLEIADSEEISLVDQTYPYIPLQRLVINSMINLVRCKLHFPYLCGHPSKTLHAFSRHASLKAARQVISLHQDIATSDIPHSADFMKIQGTILFMFIGALILATDLCCNQPHEDFERQSSELMGVLNGLSRLKRHTQIAANFLEKLTQLLVKHRVWPSVMTGTGETQRDLDLATSSPDNDLTEGPDFDTMPSFDDLWDTFIERPSLLDMIDSM